MKTAIQVGADKSTVIEARRAVLAILKTKVGEAVIIQALSTLTEICRVDNTTIQGCTFTNQD